MLKFWKQGSSRNKGKKRQIKPDEGSLSTGVGRDLSRQDVESSDPMINLAESTDGIVAPSSIQQSILTRNFPNFPERTEKYGLLSMNSQNSTNIESEQNYLLDIIAVHGMNGDAYDTWTHKNGTLWLRDFLPEDFPGARVYSFGYNVDVSCSLSTGNLDTFARLLLDGVNGERREKKDRLRRIVFVCYSMGGIVVKKAFIIARLDAKDYGSIVESTSAILFLATPHRGSGEAQLPIVLSNIGNLALTGTSRFAGRFRTDLLKIVEKDSDELEEISINFRNQIGDIEIASFIETLSTPPAKSRIVDKKSGIMGIPKERIVPMENCDHRSICRFSDRASNNYRSVLRTLKEFVGDSRRVLHDGLSDQDHDNTLDIPVYSNLSASDIHECLKSLAFPEMTYRKQQADNAYQGTCGWILQHESYLEWKIKGKGLLWIKGKPGAGKSTMMAFVCNDFNKTSSHEHHTNFGFFFHGRGVMLQKTSVGMFRSLLHQLYHEIPVARDRIQQAFKKKSCYEGKDWNWQLKELQDLFFYSVIEAAKTQKINIFVDALDEAGAETANDLADYFHRLNDFSDDAGARICISCRHFPIVARISSLEILVEENNHDDILTYVQGEINGKIQMKPAAEEILWKKFEDDIMTKASGVFQWVRLVVPLIIRYHKEGESLTCIRETLEKVPKKLSNVYEHILKKVIETRNWKKTLHLMQWICLAECPLSVTELRYAINFDMTDARFQSRDIVENDALMEKRVKALSGGLAEINKTRDSNTVQFIHQSVLDFLLSVGLKFLFSAGQDIEQRILSNENVIGQSQNRLSRSCVNFLILENVQFDHAPIFDKHKFRIYATRSWLSHGGKAESYGFSQLDLIQQFESHSGKIFQKWLRNFDFMYRDMRSFSGSSSLHIASKSNLQITLQALLNKGRHVDERDDDQRTALHYAARFGQKYIINMLLDAGAKIEARTQFYDTPLRLAAKHGHTDVITLLLDRGANLNENFENSGSALEAAALSGNTNLVEMIIKRGAEIDAKSGNVGNALQAASCSGFEAIVRLLLQNRADVNAQGGCYGNALQAASYSGSETTVQLLLENGADVNARGGKYGTALQAASLMESETIVRMLLKKGADVNAKGGEYGNALHAATLIESETIVRLLLEEGADVNAQGGWYGNALQTASVEGFEALVRLLLENGADVNAKGGEYGNALQAASVKGFEAIIQLLLKKGADVNTPGGAWGSALNAARRHSHLEVFTLLKAAKKLADPNYNEEIDSFSRSYGSIVPSNSKDNEEIDSSRSYGSIGSSDSEDNEEVDSCSSSSSSDASSDTEVWYSL